MVDLRLRRATAPLVDWIGRRLARYGVSANVLTVTGWLSGVGACVAILGHAWSFALAGWILNRGFDALDGAVARAGHCSDLGGFLDLIADFSIYGGVILALAVATPGSRVAMLALFLAYYVSAVALLSIASLLDKAGQRAGDERSLRLAGGLAEGAETFVVYCAFLLLPSDITPIAWGFTVAVGITAIQRIRVGVHILRSRDPITPIASEPFPPVLKTGKDFER